ncbi:Chromodomain-helicase-DNA-binding protein 1-like [Gonapodya sp. JEL0774]|nr:Chromodomain-helicase-DNA-binding protein 1-like [Gonapodya sp. JEL0774]
MSTLPSTHTNSEGTDLAKPTVFVALIVAQRGPKNNQPRSAILSDALEGAFEKLATFAKALSHEVPARVSIHMPRIGQSTPGFDWYRTERVVRKWLVGSGVETYVYYFARGRGAGSVHRQWTRGEAGPAHKRPKVSESAKGQQESDEYDKEDGTAQQFSKDIFQSSVFYILDLQRDQQVSPEPTLQQTQGYPWARRLIIAHGGTLVDSLDGDEVFPRYVLMLNVVREGDQELASEKLKPELKALKKRILVKSGTPVHSPLLVDSAWLVDSIRLGYPRVD